MGFFSLHAYDADVWLPQFRGLNQADIGLNPDMRFAAVAENVETPLGVLQPMAANIIADGPADSLGEHPKVETLAVLYRRWYTGDGSKTWYVCAAGGKLYYKQDNDYDGWTAIEMPLGVDSFQSNLWSWVTYEAPSDDGTVDVLLMTNHLDGMIMITPPDRPYTWDDIKATYTWDDMAQMTWDDIRSAKWTISPVNTKADPDDPEEEEKKFAVIERYGERIWGAGVPGEPDMLAYSRAYKPTNWTPSGDNEQPEDGAGDILQPSWDGDQFFALRRLGDQLLAFKNDKIWRVMGFGPGEFTFQEQYGRGTKYFSTIAVYGERVFMASEDGVLVFDGMNTTPYAKEQIRDIWQTVNKAALDQMSAAMVDQRYYLAFPTGDSAVNNAMLIFDLNEGTILFYPGIHIETFLPAGNKLFAASSTLPGKILQIRRDSWKCGAANGAPCRWVTPWTDFGYKRIQKGGFDLYFLPEVQEEEVTFTISIQTEKKTKTKTYTCQPLSESQRGIKEHRVKRLHFGGTGRRFRIIIETAEGVTAPWRLTGGLQLVVETDPD